MTCSTRIFDPLSPLPQIPKFCYTNIAFSLETHCSRRHTCTCTTKFLHHLGVGCCSPETTFKTKIGGGWASGASKKFGTPYVFLQPLKSATSNLVHNLGSGLAYEKTTLRTNIGGGLGYGNLQKIEDPLLISATVEANNIKFGTQLAFGTSLPKKQRLGPKLAGIWAREHPKKIYHALRISATVEASNFKFGIQLGFGTSLPKNNLYDQNLRGLG